MRIAVTGATGFVGRRLCPYLLAKGHEIVFLTRQLDLERFEDAKKTYVRWDPAKEGPWQEAFDGVDAVINLAGESIVNKRWSRKQKMRILESRVGATQTVVHAIEKAKKKPSVLINASAVGYYGPHGDEEVTEESSAGIDFLADVCKAWEAHATRAEDFGVRVVRLRIGIVIDRGGGALGKMLLPFLLGLGGPLGTGKQWMSWIHREDLAGLMEFLLGKGEAKGAVNATAPYPVTMDEFARKLARVLHRPCLFRVPEIPMKILMGEVSSVLLTGQRVLPKRATALGYPFKYVELLQALEASLKK